MRSNGRALDELRDVKITPNVMENAYGSCLIEMGKTKVLCTASVGDKLPLFLKGTGKGWVTAEYAMLPCSSPTRITREGISGKVKGRSQEIQRLIGRSVRAVCDLEMLSERVITLDCDVLQADGGTRCASVTGAFIAFAFACERLWDEGLLAGRPYSSTIAAVSCGIVDGEPMLDLDYGEDSNAICDMNVVMTDDGGIVEIQSTGEKKPFTKDEFDALLTLAASGIATLCNLSKNLRKEL